MRLAAATSLQRPQELGGLHGDVELRNAVCRDGIVLWVDLELSKLRAEDEAGFASRAAQEGRAGGAFGRSARGLYSVHARLARFQADAQDQPLEGGENQAAQVVARNVPYHSAHTP